MNAASKNEKTVLIAGAAGFVPGHMSEYLLRQGFSVIGLDNFITGTKENLKVLTKYDHFEFHECNIYESLPDFGDRSIDYILSMASPASPIDFPTIPIEIMRVNAEGTRKLLELAVLKKAIFLEASTSEVYGDPLEHPQKETYWGNVSCNGPRSCYDESKRYAEALTMSFHHKFQLSTRIVRIFNTYGPRMRPDDGRVIPNFVNQALKGEDLTVYGDGHQTRSFCYVDDLVRGIWHVVTKGDHTPYNVGSTDEIPVEVLAQRIISVLKSPSKIVYKNLPKDDPKRRRPDLTKIHAISGYEPMINFDEGIRLTAEYFVNYYHRQLDH
jgi:dTDP-glucose 4,6-dehydratase